MGILQPESVTHLWAKHSAALVLYARQWCHAPEDVVQEAFLLLARQAIAPQNPVGWLYQVVRNGAINAARSGRRRLRRETIAASKSDPWFEPSNDERLDAAAATEALTQLPITQREVIVARLWGGLSFDEIARISGSSAATVHRRYWRGIAALRERLNKSCPTTIRPT